MVARIKRENNSDELVITSETVDRRKVTERYESTHFLFITESEKLVEERMLVLVRSLEGGILEAVFVQRLRVENEASSSRLEVGSERKVFSALDSRSDVFLVKT